MVWHLQEPEYPHATDHECGILSRFLGHLNLSEAGFQVHGGKEPGTDHGFHGLLHAGEWVRVLPGMDIKSPEVSAEPVVAQSHALLHL